MAGLIFFWLTGQTNNNLRWKPVTSDLAAGRRPRTSLAIAAAAGLTFVPTPQVGNTVTPDKWMMRWAGAAANRARQPNPTQPVSGYPPSAPSNSRTEWDWYIPWQAATHARPLLGKQYQPFVPKEAVLENTVTPDYWQRPFDRMPKFGVPGFKPYAPFVPKEAVLENTVTPDAWLYRFQKAVPYPKPIPTQPFFGYPYISQDNNVTIDKWQQPFSVITQLGHPLRTYLRGGAPFVPKEAVLENTVTPDKWMQLWRGPPRIRPAKTNVIFPAQVPVIVSNTVTLDKWQFRWIDRPPFTRRPPGYFVVPRRSFVFFTQEVDCDIVLTVNMHICGWETEAQDASAFSDQSEQSDVWSEQAENDDDYDEQDECGR